MTTSLDYLVRRAFEIAPASRRRAVLSPPATLELADGWSPAGDVDANHARWHRDRFGVVHLAAVLAATETASLSALELPVAARPAHTVTLIAIAQAIWHNPYSGAVVTDGPRPERVQIAPAGQLVGARSPVATWPYVTRTLSLAGSTILRFSGDQREFAKVGRHLDVEPVRDGNNDGRAITDVSYTGTSTDVTVDPGTSDVSGGDSARIYWFEEQPWRGYGLLRIVARWRSGELDAEQR